MINIPFVSHKKKNPKIKPVVLVVLDGFGIAPPSKGNAIAQANTPNINSYRENYLYTELIASGESVGLPANEVGNTEVGHLTLGAGRTMYQDLKKIDMSIQKGLFYDNKAFLKAASYVKTNGSKLHLMGLVGTGHVHSSLQHLYALLQFSKKEGVEQVYLHLFTDGRDSPPQQGLEIIKDIQGRIKNLQLGEIATVSGRYYAMDRDRRWERTRKAYEAIVLGKGNRVNSPESAVQQSYKEGKTDEFIVPTVILKDARPTATIGDNDAVIFFNFRIDRPRQLAMAIVMKDFENLKSFDFGYDQESYREEGEVEISKTFKREKVAQNLFFVTMTEYAKDLRVSAIAFTPETVNDSLPEILSRSGFLQMHMSESEKERFVTYYFNGMREGKFNGEDVHIVASPKVATYDKKPEMSLPELVKQFKKVLSKDKYHFFIINFANADMVAHSGNLEATVEAIGYIDSYISQLVNSVLEIDGTIFITADHGNAEELLTYPNNSFFVTTSEGDVNTDHSNNPVPLFIVNKAFKGKGKRIAAGTLADVAPTILRYIGVQKPKDMTGEDLFSKKIDEKINTPSATNQIQTTSNESKVAPNGFRYIPPQVD